MPVRPLLTLFASLVLTLSTEAQITAVNFDGVSAPGAFQQIFPGLANGPHLEYPGVTLDGGVILNDALFDGAATSGSNILASCDTCLLGDNPPSGLPGVITGVFDAPITYIEFSTSNGTGQTATVSLRAFDAQGASLGGVDSQLGPQGSASDTSLVGYSISSGDIASFTLELVGVVGYTFAMDSLRFGDLPGAWGTFGTGLAGIQGVPQLTGEGELVAGSANSVAVRRGVPTGDAFLVVGLTQVDLAFKGGVLIPSLDLLLGPLPLDAQGATSLPFTWPSGLPSGLSLLMQAWIPDAAGPVGFSSSAGLVASTN